MDVYKTAPDINLLCANVCHKVNTATLKIYLSGEIIKLTNCYCRVIPNSDFVVIYFDTLQTEFSNEIFSFCLSSNFQFVRDIITGIAQLIFPKDRILAYYPYKSGLQK